MSIKVYLEWRRVNDEGLQWVQDKIRTVQYYLYSCTNNNDKMKI